MGCARPPGMRKCARRVASTVPGFSRSGTDGKAVGGVRHKMVWKTVLGLERTVVEDVDLDGDALVISVRSLARERDRCPLSAAI